MLGSVQGALAELSEEDTGLESAHEHAGILFFAYHFWRVGTEVVLMQRKTVRTLLAGGTEGEGKPGWGDGLAGRAGYVPASSAPGPGWSLRISRPSPLTDSSGAATRAACCT